MADGVYALLLLYRNICLIYVYTIVCFERPFKIDRGLHSIWHCFV